MKLELSEWKDRYNKCVNKYIDSYEKIISERHTSRNTLGNNSMKDLNNIYRKAYLGLLSTIVKMHSICICVYKFNNNLYNMVECV